MTEELNEETNQEFEQETLETVETDELEQTEETPGEESSEENQEESSEEKEQEFFDSETDYMGAYGIEDESLDSAMGNYKKLLDKQKEEPKETLVEPAPIVPPVEPTQDNTWKLGDNHMTSYVDDLVKDGRLIGDENIQSYKSMAKVMDSGMNPALEKINNMMSALSQPLSLMFKEVREASWRRFKHKDLIGSRSDLDSIMNQKGLVSYDEAFQTKLAGDKNLLAKFAQAANKKGVEKGSKKKQYNFSSNRRSKPAPQKGSFNLKPYMLPDGVNLDMGKVNALESKSRRKIVDAFAKKNGVE